jgi:hypothetical protein
LLVTTTAVDEALTDDSGKIGTLSIRDDEGEIMDYLFCLSRSPGPAALLRYLP